jgi:hypothetical protein
MRKVLLGFMLSMGKLIMLALWTLLRLTEALAAAFGNMVKAFIK